VEVTQDDTVIENQTVNTSTQTTTSTVRNQALNTNTNTTFTTQTNINKAITTNTTTVANTNTNGPITTVTSTTTDTGAGAVFGDGLTVDMDGDYDTGFIEMDMDIVAQADVDGFFEVTGDRDYLSLQPEQGVAQGDVESMFDVVADVDGVQADVDTGVNVVTTATSATP
jgi:hypothetical protein